MHLSTEYSRKNAMNTKCEYGAKNVNKKYPTIQMLAGLSSGEYTVQNLRLRAGHLYLRRM